MLLLFNYLDGYPPVALFVLRGIVGDHRFRFPFGDYLDLGFVHPKTHQVLFVFLCPLQAQPEVVIGLPV